MNSYPHRGGTGTDTRTDSNNGNRRNDNDGSGDHNRRAAAVRYVIPKTHNYMLSYLVCFCECKYIIKIFNHQTIEPKTVTKPHKTPFYVFTKSK